MNPENISEKEQNNTSKLGLYVHVPWCRRRCVYCDFYFEIGKPEASYAKLLEREYLSKLVKYELTGPSTLYFGGGTPSLLSIGSLENIIQFTGIDPSVSEVTIEANPEDLDVDRAQQMKDIGINRLSLGVQSLRDTTLKWLGRKHRSFETRNLIEGLATKNIKLSVDVIIGVPGENLMDIEEDLGWLRSLGVGHISLYLLTLEQTAPLNGLIQKGVRQKLNEDEQAESYISLQQHLKRTGYEQYEISSYALRGQSSIHNRNYWCGEPYIGIGPGAHSMLHGRNGQTLRFANLSNLKLWKNSPEASMVNEERLQPQAAFLEAVAFGLRDVKRGINLEKLALRHEVKEFAFAKEAVINLFQDGYLYKLRENIALTERGTLFADHVAREILGSGI